MDNPQLTPASLPPAQVLSYEIGEPRNYFWLARLVCALALTNGLVSAGYVGASRIPSANPGQHPWTDLPVVICGLSLAVWSALGLFRVSGAKTGMMISAGAMLLANWAAQWVGLGLYGPPDPSSVATALVGVVDNASIPVFLIISLFCEPVRGYFSGHRLGS